MRFNFQVKIHMGNFRRRGRSDGAMVLGKFPVPGRPTNLDNCRAVAYYVCGGCGWRLFWTFFLTSVISRFFLPLSGRRSDIE